MPRKLEFEAWSLVVARSGIIYTAGQNKLELLKRAVKEGMDEIDRGEFVVVKPDEIDGFVDKLAAKVLKRNG